MDPTLRDRAETLLLKADRAHGIHAGREAVQNALSDAQSGIAFVQWATNHLETENLLTADELAL